MTAKISRRTLLRGAGGVSVALPFLSSMEAASAQTLPKRLVIMFSSNGVLRDQWVTGGGENDFQVGRILQPLMRHRSDLTLIQGVHSTLSQQSGNAHQAGVPHMLTATNFVDGRNNGSGAYGPAGGPSVDQVIADGLRGQTPFASLEFGVKTARRQAEGIWDRMSWRAARESVPPEDDPLEMFRRVFADVGPGGGTVGPDVRRHQEQQGSILDFVRGQYEQIQGVVGAADRQRLDAHLTHLREIERRLTDGSSASCARPGEPASRNVASNDNVPEVGRDQMDLIASSFACDLTRVATLQWGQGQSDITHTWLGHGAGHHSISHRSYSNYSTEQLLEASEWYAEQFASLIDRLKAIPEGTGTVFDNTVLLWLSETGTPSTHDRENIPYVLAGSLGGAFSTGRYVRVPGDRMAGDLFVTLMNAMGVSASTFGNQEYAQGPVTELLA